MNPRRFANAVISSIVTRRAEVAASIERSLWRLAENPRRLTAAQELRHGALAGAGEPSLFDDGFEFLRWNHIEPDQYGRISIEMRRRKEHLRIAAQQRFLHFQILRTYPQDRSFRSSGSERRNIRRPQRTLPREKLLIDDPRRSAAGPLLFGRPRQCQSIVPYVAPRCHHNYLLTKNAL